MYAPLRATAAMLSRAVSPRLSGASVLCYHSVGDNMARSTIPPESFEHQMAYVASRYQVLAPSELIAALSAGESVAGSVVITFDDGYADNFTHALPILEKYRIRAGVFVITSLIGKTNMYSGGVEIPVMDRTQLRESCDRGLEILTHTKTHRDMRDVPDTELEDELEGSRNDLESIIGSPIPRIVAFPKGRSDERVRAWLAGKGWHAFGTRSGVITSTSQACDLERNGVRRTTTTSEFKMMLSDGITIFERLRSFG